MMDVFSDPNSSKLFKAHVAESLPWAGLPRCSSCDMCLPAFPSCEPGHASPRKRQKQLPEGRHGCTMLETWSIFHMAPEKQHLQPSPGAWWGMIYPPFLLDKSNNDNWRWSERLHRRQRCSNNWSLKCHHIHITEKMIHRKFCWNQHLKSYWKPTGNYSSQKKTCSSGLEFVSTIYCFGVILLK